REVRGSDRDRASDVRGRGSGSVHLVRQELRTGREPICRSQPDRSTRVFAIGDLGNEERLGSDYVLPLKRPPLSERPSEPGGITSSSELVVDIDPGTTLNRCPFNF